MKKKGTGGADGSEETPLRILVADDHEIVRTGLITMLQGSGIEVIAQTARADEVMRLVRQHKPDVALLDVRLQEGDGLTLLGRLKLDLPDVQVVLFSAYDNPTFAARAVALGASGYLQKGCDRDELVNTLRAAAEGRPSWTREQLRRVTGALATPRMPSNIEVSLTLRESEVLNRICGGRTNKEIAPELGISDETVKEHVQHILRKIGVNDRTQAAVWAVRNGLV